MGATWSGGSIPTVTLHVPAARRRRRPRRRRSRRPPPPPPPPPRRAPAAAARDAARRRAAVDAARVTSATPSAPAPSPHIALKKRALAKTVAAGSTVKYQLIVTAKGGTAHDVVVCDKLPRT